MPGSESPLFRRNHGVSGQRAYTIPLTCNWSSVFMFPFCRFSVLFCESNT